MTQNHILIDADMTYSTAIILAFWLLFLLLDKILERKLKDSSRRARRP